MCECSCSCCTTYGPLPERQVERVDFGSKDWESRLEFLVEALTSKSTKEEEMENQCCNGTCSCKGHQETDLIKFYPVSSQEPRKLSVTDRERRLVSSIYEVACHPNVPDNVAEALHSILENEFGLHWDVIKVAN